MGSDEAHDALLRTSRDTRKVHEMRRWVNDEPVSIAQTMQVLCLLLERSCKTISTTVVYCLRVWSILLFFVFADNATSKRAAVALVFTSQTLFYSC